MLRKDFLKLLTLPFTGTAMKLKDLSKLTSHFSATDPMPVLFLGHGNPMHAIADNEFTSGWKKQGSALPRPSAILCISAHWETKGTFVTAMEKPRTIHDFGGFPQELFAVQYPASGSPELAMLTKNVVSKTTIEFDHAWGLDHGCWSVILHLFPKADIPVIQMSLDYRKDPQWHYELAKELTVLRRKGVLIIGSGNIVHNLRMLSWQADKGYEWAIGANEKLKSLILSNEHQQLISYSSLGKEVQLAIPTPEHYLPLLYILGLKEEKENVSLFNDKTELGAISMTSVKIIP